jgi:hypothetical protein
MIFSRNAALIPISVDNPGFTSELMESALRALPRQYDKLVFLIADDLQLYNKVALARTGAQLSQALALFDRKNVSFTEKQRWLENLREELSSEAKHAEWNVVNISCFADSAFHKIVRNVAILNETVTQFRTDVSEAAREYCSRTKKDFFDIDVRLSQEYILEEIATNLRIRVVEGIQDEFYAFRYLQPLLKLYAGHYGISVFSLCGLPESDTSFEFYEYSKLPKPYWTKIVSAPIAKCA